MEGAALQERIILLLFKTTRRIEALLVAGAGVAGSGLAFGLGLSAFQNDDVAWHSLKKSEIGTRKL